MNKTENPFYNDIVKFIGIDKKEKLDKLINDVYYAFGKDIVFDLWKAFECNLSLINNILDINLLKYKEIKC